jgi:predicted P-loop ATPase
MDIAIRSTAKVLKMERKPTGGGGNGGGGAGGNSGGDTSSWRDNLVLNNQHRPAANPHNLMLILEHDPALAGLFWLDEFGNRVVLDRDPPWTGGVRDEFTEVDAMELAAWIGNPDRYTLSTGPELVMQCVETVARRRRRHTVREYLNSLKWDGVARVERMFVDIFSAADVPYTRAVAQNFMVSAVSRVLWSDASQPTKGSKVDFMVVLEGNQGVGKSTAVLELFGASWYAEATESPAHKDFYQTLRGRWCIEIGEMESFSKADVGKIKQAITTRFDTYRPSYGRTVRAFRRECVFVGTTNQDDYLRDATGARRFLPIKTGQVSIPALVAQRDQLWAEAVSLYKGGFEWWKLPPNAEREQDARYSEDVWTQRVWLWCNGKGNPDSYEGIAHENLDKYGRPIEFSISDVLSRALQVEAGRQGRSEDTRVGSILKKLKYSKFRPMRMGERVWVYVLDKSAPPPPGWKDGQT